MLHRFLDPHLLNLIVQVIFCTRKNKQLKDTKCFNTIYFFEFTYNLLIHVLPFVNQYQVYPKVYLYIPNNKNK